MKQTIKGGRALAKHSLGLAGACISFGVLACGSAESPTPASDAPRQRSPDAVDNPSRGDSPSGSPGNGTMPPPTGGVATSAPPEPDPSQQPREPDAPEPARTCDISIGFDDLYEAVAADLRAESDDGAFLRYVSLGNRLNQGVCPEDLERDRAALTKAINSLSTEVSMASPEAIDADASLFRIDLRDIGWDRPTVVDGVEFADKWEALRAASPYAIAFEGGDAEQAQLDAGTSVPLLFADALIGAAMIDELYYAMIEAAASEEELLAELGIDEEEDVVLRVGTSRSRLSRQDALVERFDQVAFQGYYWSRYDLAEDTGGESVFANPLGFQADSIAAVFSLPNGLNGYALFDGAGARITDTDVIVDSTQRDGRVRNGVSCSQCHAAGILPITDEVREYVDDNRFEFDADTLGEVEDTFLSQPEIDDLVRQDAELYGVALARAGVDGTGGDPVAAAYLRFDGGVTLAMAAGELGVTPRELESELGLLAARVDGTLAALRTQSLRREQFDALYLPTLCVMQAVGDNRPAADACAAVGQ